MPVLKRNAKPLLRTVANKRHADDEDHEELRPPLPKKRSDGVRELLKQREKEKEKAITASPQTSDDELAAPPALKARTPRQIVPQQYETHDEELKLPKPSVRPWRNIQTTSSSTAANADTVKDASRHDKENETALPSPSTSSGGGSFDFGMQYSSQGSGKTKVGYGKKRITRNIHAPPRRDPKAARKIIKFGGKRQEKLRAITNSNDGNESDFSDVSTKSVVIEDAEDKELRAKISYNKCSKSKNLHKTSNIFEREKDPDFPDQDTDMCSSQKPSRSTRLLGQLEDWKDTKEPASSQGGLEDLNDYLQQLPDEATEGSLCTLCKEPVELEDYWEFWKGKDRTVKNHTLFCFAHRRKSAQTEYQHCGYPEIEWVGLHQRIRRNRMVLFQVLSNQRSSQFRDRYEPLALTGKAAAVPSRRKDLPQGVQEELESYALDDQSTFPGYYGPHGRRVITEHIMKILKNEIKNCKDAVVQSSGPAAFVQAVLVPEAAVLLIMEDCKVDRERAEEIREQTYEMGMLLHEEIEDEIEPQLDSEDENDYHGQ